MKKTRHTEEQIAFALKQADAGTVGVIRAAPRTIRADNGPKFISKALDRKACENGITLNFSHPDKPTDNAF